MKRVHWKMWLISFAINLMAMTAAAVDAAAHRRWFEMYLFIASMFMAGGYVWAALAALDKKGTP